MKRALVPIVLLIAALACAIVLLRPAREPAPAVAAAEPERSAVPGVAPPRWLLRRSDVRRAPLPGGAGPAQEPPSGEAPGKPGSYEGRARDGYYDRLLLMQGRDEKKEQQVFSQVMATFGDKPDTLVGAVACSPEFCRVDLRAVGQVDVNEHWQKDLFAAVEPKGLRFFIVANDDDGNTMTSCYFGRSDSWTVPDFHALGLL